MGEAVTKDEIETMLRTMDNRKLSAFQPSVFSGQSNESAQDFLNQFENYAKLSGLEGEEKIVVFNLLLRGLAKFWFQDLTAADKATFENIKIKFKATYLSQSKNWLTTQKLENRKLLSGEKAEIYIQDIMQMANNIGMTEKEKQAALIRGLSPKLKSHLITHNPQSLAETIERIYLSETALSLQNQESVNAIDSITTCQLAGITAAVAGLSAKINAMTGNQKPEERMSQPDCYQEPETQPNFTQAPIQAWRPPRNYQQFTGWGPPRVTQNFQRPRQFNNGPRSLQNTGCFVCGRAGHFARECYHRDVRRGNNMTTQMQPGGRNNYYGGRGGQAVRFQQTGSKNFYGQQRH